MCVNGYVRKDKKKSAVFSLSKNFFVRSKSIFFHSHVIKSAGGASYMYMENILIGGESSLFDGPVYYSSSYTQILESQEQAIEAIIQPYRDDLAKALAE